MDRQETAKERVVGCLQPPDCSFGKAVSLLGQRGKMGHPEVSSMDLLIPNSYTEDLDSAWK